MEPGNIIEYIDQQKIICGIILESKNQKLRILTETAREVKLSENRVSHISKKRIPAISSREDMLRAVREAVSKRRQLAEEINAEELWEVLLDETDWMDAETIAGVCFTESTPDHESAVLRALFDNRFYKFNSCCTATSVFDLLEIEPPDIIVIDDKIQILNPLLTIKKIKSKLENSQILLDHRLLKSRATLFQAILDNAALCCLKQPGGGCNSLKKRSFSGFLT